MAVTYDTDAETLSTGAGTTVSVTLTVGSNSNKALLAFVGCEDGTTAQNVSSISYTAGSGGTWAYFGRQTNAGRNMEIWSSVAPSNGSVTVQATFAASVSAERFLHVLSLYDVDQTTPADNFASATTAATLAVTSDADGMAICGLSSNSLPGNVTGGATQTASEVNNSYWRGAYFVSSPTATFTWSSSRVMAGCNVNAVVAAAGQPTMKRWAGVPGVGQSNSIGRGW